MSESKPGSATDWEAVMAQALEDSGGPLTAEELAWASSELGLSLDAEAGSGGPVEDRDGAR